MNRALALFPDLSDMRHVLRTPVNQYQAFIEPLVAWLRPRGVNFLAGAFVRDIGFAPSDGRITVNRIDYERDGTATSVAVAAGRYRAGDHRIAGRGPFGGIDDRGATATGQRTLLGAVEAAGAGAHAVSAIPTSSSARSRCLPRAG